MSRKTIYVGAYMIYTVKNNYKAKAKFINFRLGLGLLN